MATDQKPQILASVLDRLINEDPGASREALPRRSQTLGELETTVAHDLEALLNTRREALADLSPEYCEVNRSLVVYGLPDFTALSLQSREDCDRIRRAVEQAVNNFEPRLERARVTLEASPRHDRGLRFQIEALLNVEPAPEPVMFDAVLQLSTQKYVVRGGS